MKAPGILALIGCLATVTEPKIYTRCKLAKIFARAGLDNYQGFSLGNCEISPFLFFLYPDVSPTISEALFTLTSVPSISMFCSTRNNHQVFICSPQLLLSGASLLLPCPSCPHSWSPVLMTPAREGENNATRAGIVGGRSDF